MTNGWDQSAGAWIADMGEAGDFGRRHVLDGPMMALASARVAAGATAALDVGCGEGRFCRMLAGLGMATTGVDPTRAFIDHARAAHPAGDYRLGAAEALDFPGARFDLVVSYLTLIDIDDVAAAVAEMARVLKPGGALLIANLNGFNTAGLGPGLGWRKGLGPDGAGGYVLDRYLEPRAAWTEWRGIRVRNWHRPLGLYMGLLLGAGLTLSHFAEPAPTGGDTAKADRYRRAPWFLVMEWVKPG